MALVGVHGGARRTERLSEVRVKDQRRHQERSRLADGDEVRGVSRLLFQGFQDGPVLLHLALEVFVMSLALPVEGDFLGAFLLHDRHARQAAVSHVEGDALGDVGVVPGPGREDDRVIPDVVPLAFRDVDEPHAREIDQHLSRFIETLAGRRFAEEFQKFGLAVPRAFVAPGRHGENVRHRPGHPPLHPVQAVRQETGGTLDERARDEKTPHLEADAARRGERVEPEKRPAVAEADHLGGQVE
ncbi:MAG: hypothetical protein MUE76_06285 [Syntrophales bacterium]|nr:hypothetical protein [Syntrophales bacterium]